MEEKIQFIQDNWKLITGILAGVYTLLVRLFPTSKNWCFIDKAVKIFNTIVPNRAIDITYLQKGKALNEQVVKECKTHVLH